MTRLNLILLLVLLASCIWLVRTGYDSRRLYAQLDAARNENHALEVEFKRLTAARQEQATHAKVDRVARERLHMRAATPGITQVVDLPGAAPAAPPSASGPLARPASGVDS